MTQEHPVQYNYDKRHVIFGLTALFLIYGTMAFSIQSLNIARPKIAAELDGMSIYAWSVSIPGLVSAIVTLIFGKLSDIYGRRIMLMISLALSLAGSILSVLSTTFVFFIIAAGIRSLGIGALMPLVFAIVGDMLPPVQRSKWIGLLQAPIGVAALCGPALGGWFADGYGWEYLFWITAFLFVICLFLVPFGVPAPAHRGSKTKIDIRGCLFMIIASSTLIIGISLGGVKYPWDSPTIVGLLAISVISWTLFFREEYRANAPILDPIVLQNRTFNTIAGASLMGIFGQMGMMMYFPMYLQGVQGVDAALSGIIYTPCTVLVALLGVPAGFLLAKTKRYKWIYICGFAIITASMFCVLLLREDTSILFSFLISTMAGLGMGALPTVNTVVVQNAVPKRLMGVAMGGTFFCLMLGVAIAPAILGSVEQTVYTNTLEASLPDELNSLKEKENMNSLIDSQVLLSEPDMKALENAFMGMGKEGEALLEPTIEAIRKSMEVSIKRVFWIAAIASLLSFLLITTIPEVPLGSAEEEE